MKIKTEKTAIQFYKQIEDNNKYKLVNGIFIVKYINEDTCIYIGEFIKKETLRNPRKNNVILVIDNPENLKNQRFKSKKYVRNSLGFWKDLDIEFKEKPIEEILK